MAERSPLVVGNWKMNGLRGALAELEAIAAGVARHPGVNVVVCPPSTLIERAAAAAKEFEIGAQDCHAGEGTAFTGRLSPAMLFDAGARWVIVGHSECRQLAQETDEMIREKAERALAAGLAVIVCVGESSEERDRGQQEMIVLSQLSGSMPREPGENLAIAYEPIWAIGTGRTPTTAQVELMHAHIRDTLVGLYGEPGECLPILYGGSASPANASQLLSIDGVDGLLVGGASLSADSFLPIVGAAAMLAPQASMTTNRIGATH
jgi:triosephosphate isomerase